MRALAIDLYCGLGGWTDGLLLEGYDVIGFDIERHDYGRGGYPAQLVLQDVTTLHGSQFRNADLIVASPPCQAYSYRAMPWKRAKALPPPDNTLFEACFRIQREAIEAAGHHIPLVVENVCGAQKWVGRAKWHFGSFYLWGDVPALMPMTEKIAKVGGITFSGYGEPGYKAVAFSGTAEQRLRATKNDGGSWFAVAHNTESGKGRNPDGWKVPPHELHPAAFGWHKDGWLAALRRGEAVAGKDGTKQAGIGGPRTNGKGDAWFQDGAAHHGSRSNARKAASAEIAKIPLPLSRWIGNYYRPVESETVRDYPLDK